MLIPPVTYQGGKHRIASDILDIVNVDPNEDFHDLCCGSGSIAISLVNRGHDPLHIHMLDASPWGLFWKMVGDGSFDIEIFRHYIEQIPSDPKLVHDFVKELASQSPRIDTAYVFIILQAASFGGKAIWMHDMSWRTHGFRDYWTPTATSNRRSPVNPMMPMPTTLLGRVESICEKMVGVHGYHADITMYAPKSGIAYVDPPYAGTTSYGYTFEAEKYIANVNVPIYISEGKPMSEKSWCISSGRKKGGISGKRTAVNEEWLSFKDIAAGIAA